MAPPKSPSNNSAFAGAAVAAPRSTKQDLPPIPADSSSSSRTVQALIMAAVLPLLVATCGAAFLYLYNAGLIQSYLIPLFKTYFGLQPRDIPYWTVFVLAVHAYGVSSLFATVAKCGSEEGFDNNHPRLMAYRGITHRFAAAHNNAVESFPLIAAAVLLSQQSGVPVSIRAQFAAYAFVARVLHYLFYLTNLSIPRSVAWFSYSVPCYLLLIASAIPGFSKAYLQAGGR